LRDRYKTELVARAAAAREAVTELKSGTGSPGTAATIARSASDLRNILREAITGDATPIGTHFGDVYQWQKKSPTARMALGIASAGLSEVWFSLNESLDD